MKPQPITRVTHEEAREILRRCNALFGIIRTEPSVVDIGRLLDYIAQAERMEHAQGALKAQCAAFLRSRINSVFDEYLRTLDREESARVAEETETGAVPAEPAAGKRFSGAVMAALVRRIEALEGKIEWLASKGR